MSGARPIAGRRVLVTGASGFYGLNLLAQLAGSGAVVASASRSAPPADWSVDWEEVDLSDSIRTAALFKKFSPEISFHLTSASLGGPEIGNVGPSVGSDLLPTLNVLEAAARFETARVVIPCSMEEPLPVMDPDGDIAIPGTPYAMSKLVCGLYGRFFREKYRVPVVMLRCFLTYGPHQKSRKIVPYVINSLLRGQPPRLSSGNRMVDWIYVDDVVSAFLAAAAIDVIPSQTLEVGTGTLTSIRDVVTMIHRLMGGPDPVFENVEVRGCERVSRIDLTSKLQKWSPRVTLEEGLPRTIDYYAQQMTRSSP